MHQPTPGTPAWREYLHREHDARDMYLTVVARAHQEYLTGPYPDRDAYTLVERQAWITYYTAGRQAWQQYKADMEMAATVAVTGDPGTHPYPPRTPQFDGQPYTTDHPLFTPRHQTED